MNVTWKYPCNDCKYTYRKVSLFVDIAYDYVQKRRRKHHKYVGREEPVFAAYHGEEGGQQPLNAETFFAVDDNKRNEKRNAVRPYLRI